MRLLSKAKANSIKLYQYQCVYQARPMPSHIKIKLPVYQYQYVKVISRILFLSISMINLRSIQNPSLYNKGEETKAAAQKARCKENTTRLY